MSDYVELSNLTKIYPTPALMTLPAAASFSLARNWTAPALTAGLFFNHPVCCLG